MTLLSAGAKAVGITGGFFGFGTATYLNYGKIMLLTEYNTELQDLVHNAMVTYKEQVNSEKNVNSSMSIYDAYSVIGGYAWLCTLPGIDSLARSALSTGAEATAPVPKKPAGAPAVPAVPPPPPRRALVAPAPPPALPGPGAVSPSVVVPQITVVR